MTPPVLASLVDAARRIVRRDAVLAVTLTTLAVVPIVLVFAWLLGGLQAWSAPGPGPLLLLIGGAVAASGLAVWAARLWVRGIDETSVTARAEETVGLPAGSLRGVLELGRSVPAGTSEALFRRAEHDVASRFTGRDARGVSGELGRRTRRRLAAAALGLAGLTVIAGALALASPRRTQASWAPLLRPVSHLTPPPLPPLDVVPGDATVQRGSDLDVRIRAPGRAAVSIVWRSEGSVLEREVLQIAAADTVSGRIPRIDARTLYWVEAPDGAKSATYTISPLDPLLVSELVVEVVFPAYLGRTPERYDAEVPPLQLPEGTSLVFRGRATRALQNATLFGNGETALHLGVDGDRFSAQWTPTRSGVFGWRIEGAGGLELASDPSPLDLTIVGDEPPRVELSYPLGDTILSADFIQLVAAEASDDHGLAAASLVSWRVGGAGEADSPREEPIPLDGDEQRTLLRGTLDASGRGLLPGDTLKMLVRVTDASPRRQTAESRILSLYVPGMAELRDRVGEEAASLIDDAGELARMARQMEQATRDLQRRTSAASARRNQQNQSGASRGNPGESASLDFQEREQARQVMEQQEEMLRQMEEMRDRLNAFDEAARRAGLQDAELRREMEELRQLYDQLITPEMREQLEQLKQSLENMDPAALEKALEQLGEQQDRMREQLEKSLETMRRAAAEQQMNALAQDARELAAQQQALAETMRERPPTSQETGQQKGLEEQTRELQEAMEALRQQLERQGEQQAASGAEQARDAARQAAEQMQQAASQAQERQGGEASRRGEEAARGLEQAAQSLEGARQQMAEGWKQELQESVQQAMNEALSLAQRQQELLEKMQQAGQEQQQGQEQQGQQQSGQQQGQQQSGQQQGQQQSGQQQGQQQSGQQQGQQQGGQQQGQQQGGQQQGQQQGGQQQGGQQQGGGAGGTGQALQSEQQALQQGLEQIGRNLSEAGDRGSLLDREVGSALGRANLSMQQTLQAMQQSDRAGANQAEQAVDALNRLAMALLQRSQQLDQEGPQSALEQVMQQLADAAKQQGSLNGQSSAIMPMNLAPGAMSKQTSQMAEEQREIASKLEGMSNRVGNRDDLLGQLDQLAEEAQRIAQILDVGRLPPEVLARQERLFHRLLDAGRTLEKEEYSEERVGELPGAVGISRAPALDPSLIDPGSRFRVPTAEEMRALPPAYRRLVLEYFARLNRTGSEQERR
jgi:hypothetical protein